ncbi:MAG: cytidylyltransferase domain-containing protein [Sphingomonadaceae bacterium]
MTALPAGTITAIIPARGGSKGVPRKNVLPLMGKPLLAHTIEAALASRHVARVAVSTDDPEIAAVARRFGAEVVDRPAEIAGDKASSEAALLHALDTLHPAGAPQPDLFVFLQCTSPLTRPEDIDALVEAFRREGADSAFLATRFYHFLWRADALGDFHGVNHDRTFRQMRQDRPAEYLETGAGYAIGTAGFREHGHRFFGKVVAVEMPGERVGEIDTADEFAVIEARMRAARAGAAQAMLPQPVAALVMDFDGVLTDDAVMLSQDGVEHVRCSRSDGMGIDLLRTAGLPMIVLSREDNPVVAARCAKLRIPCVHGLRTKLATLTGWADEHGVDLARTVYVGNDVNDLECMAAVGFPVAPADAHPSACDAARLVLTNNGGHGAIRELADMILRQRKALP